MTLVVMFVFFVVRHEVDRRDATRYYCDGGEPVSREVFPEDDENPDLPILGEYAAYYRANMTPEEVARSYSSQTQNAAARIVACRLIVDLNNYDAEQPIRERLARSEAEGNPISDTSPVSSGRPLRMFADGGGGDYSLRFQSRDTSGWEAISVEDIVISSRYDGMTIGDLCFARGGMER